MTSPSDILNKASRTWQSGRIMTAALQGIELFPLDIPFQKVGAKGMLENFSAVSDWKSKIQAESKERKGYGYSIDYAETTHRQLGLQRIPSRIYFATMEDFLRYVGKSKDFARFSLLADETLKAYPKMRGWLEKYPIRLLENEQQWSRLLAVCSYLQANPKPQLYLRQLDIPGVDSKFIEQNKAILRDLLDVVLSEWIDDTEIMAISGHGFERRYHFRYDAPLIRFRILDPTLFLPGGVSDVSVPLGQFLLLKFPCEQVFITENKVNGLCFPYVSKSIVIFGLGYGVSSLRDASWLADREIHYWGDIDTHGFSILSQLRNYFPHVHSFLMDRETLEQFRHLWGREDSDKRCNCELSCLTAVENKLYNVLKGNVLGENLRLEQERVSFTYLERSICNRRGGVKGEGHNSKLQKFAEIADEI